MQKQWLVQSVQAAPFPALGDVGRKLAGKLSSATLPFLVFSLCLWPFLVSLLLILPPSSDLYVRVGVAWVWSQPPSVGSRHVHPMAHVVAVP